MDPLADVDRMQSDYQADLVHAQPLGRQEHYASPSAEIVAGVGSLQSLQSPLFVCSQGPHE
jgi:hypothetical protein